MDRRWALGLLTGLVAGCGTMPNPDLVSRVVDVPPQSFTVETQPVQNLRGIGPFMSRLDLVPFVQTADGWYQPVSSRTGLETTVDDPDMVRLTDASASLGGRRPFTLKHLMPHHRYRVYALAYDAYGGLISRVQRGDWLDLDLGLQDRPRASASLPVHLETQPQKARVAVALRYLPPMRVGRVQVRLDLVGDHVYLPVIRADVGGAPKVVAIANLRPAATYRITVSALGTHDEPVDAHQLEVLTSDGGGIPQPTVTIGTKGP
jgi:hypothetical protein